MRRGALGRVVAASLFALLPLVVAPTSAVACSPPFEPITLEGLGPAQVVVLGRIGDKVPGGRVFHVERWFNGGQSTAEIVIAFKEGEAVGDCSYPVHLGEHVIIAPRLEPDGQLTADLLTLQGDPATPEGVALIRDATTLYGPGVIPMTGVPAVAVAEPPWPAFVAIAVVATLVVTAMWLAVHSRRRSRRST